MKPWDLYSLPAIPEVQTPALCPVPRLVFNSAFVSFELALASLNHFLHLIGTYPIIPDGCFENQMIYVIYVMVLYVIVVTVNHYPNIIIQKKMMVWPTIISGNYNMRNQGH